ncbi:LysR family transcriptional regulator [Pasteurella testudinis]
MNLDHIKLFTLVVQQGSLSAASVKSGVAVATLSRKISELEQSLGVQLLERSTQGVKPTLIGLQLSEQAALSLETLSDLAHRIKGNQAELKGRLRLSMPESFEPWWQLQQDFAERYPDIDVHLLASDRKLDLLADGIDVAVRVGDLQTDSFIAKKLFDIRLQLVASPEFVQRYGTPTTPADLSRFRCNAWAADNSQDIIWQLGTKPQRI